MAGVWTVFLVLLNLVLSGRGGGSQYEDHGEDFILDGSLARVARSAAGELRAVFGTKDENRPLWEHDVSIGSISMEPNALLLPHYLDAAVVLLVLQGAASVTWIQGKDVASQLLKAGDVFSLPVGTVFYMINSDGENALKIISMMDTSASFHKGQAQHFFVAGGMNPEIILSGFKADLIAAAFKVRRDEIPHLFNSQRQGPIIYTTIELSEVFTNKGDKHSKKHKKVDKDAKKHKKADKEDHKKSEKESHDGKDDKRKEQEDKHTRNLFERPTFSSEHGWLATSGRLAGRVDVFAVHLNAGSMIAPYWNPRGCVFGVVTKGYGSIQIAYSNGTNAVDEPLRVGRVFYVPPFLPVTQIAAPDSSLEFVGFTVVSHGMEESHLQFLAGNDSVLHHFDLRILALSLDVPESLLRCFLDAQPESVILPSATEVQLADL